MMNKSIIGILLVVIVAGIAFGLYEYNREPEGISTMKVDYEISAVELMELYSKNEVEANEKFLDKVLLINGKVSGNDNKDGKKSIYLETEEPLSNIICQLEDYESEVPDIGETISVKGICTGYLMDVVMIKSKIEK